MGEAYSHLGTDAAVAETPRDQYFRKYEPGSDTGLQLALLRQPCEGYCSLSLKPPYEVLLSCLC
jgi:hypothetical protein